MILFVISACIHEPSTAQLASLTDEHLSVSTFFSSDLNLSFSRINSAAGWAALNNDANQWIQVTLNEVKVIVKVATQGRGDWDQWVTSYKLQTSYGGSLEFVLGADGAERVFAGNVDRDSIVEYCLGEIQASTVRLLPQTWYRRISMRWEVYALEYEGTVEIPYSPGQALTVKFSIS